MILRVEPDGWQLPVFAAGQFAVIGLPGSAPRCALSEPEESPADPNKLIRRAYSIASSSLTKPYMDFYVALVTSGALTPRLFGLKIGDRIWLSPKIAGLFTFDQMPADKHVVMIATGTGLAPYMSMLQHASDVRGGEALRCAARRAALVGSSGLSLATDDARTPVQQPELHPDHQPAARRADPVDGCHRLRRGSLKNGALDKVWGFHPSPDDTHFFLCGAPAMIDETSARRRVRKGSKNTRKKTPGEIHVERYW